MRPTITNLLLDVDDVLNRCTMSALRFIGCPVNPYDSSVFEPAWGWDIIKAANALHPTFHEFTPALFWEAIDRGFWATIPKSEEFGVLLAMAEALVGTEGVCMLTAPTLDPDCAAGKIDWIKKMIPKRLQRQYLIGPRKYFCANRNSLLIDDSNSNVASFREHGGNAVLMPRPWNSLNRILNPLSYVADTILGDYQFCKRTRIQNQP